MALIFVTANPHKFKEASEIAARYGIELKQRDVPYIEIQSNELRDVVRIGSQQACTLAGAPCFVEDAGLFVRALKGFPGPYSKFIFQTLGNDGILKLMSGVKDRSAEFKSVVGYCEPGKKPEVFEGKAEGTLALEAKGTYGFGFDPVFISSESDGRTFGEMSTAEKNKHSHRAKAIEAFFSWYKKKSGGS